jgi:hypothetical protein
MLSREQKAIRKRFDTRLANHLHGLSSFTKHYLEGKGSKLRQGYSYRCLPVKNLRRRALLEAYAIGCLCPKHIGLGQIREEGEG